LEIFNPDFNAKVLRSVQLEMNAIDFYTKLLKMAKNNEEQKIIKSIIADEQEHFLFFSYLYAKLTGQRPKDIRPEEKSPASYRQGLEESALDEIDDANFYRDMIFMISDQSIKDGLYRVVTDEQGHATKFTLIFAKQK
jgi:rubrerythrin